MQNVWRISWPTSCWTRIMCKWKLLHLQYFLDCIYRQQCYYVLTASIRKWPFSLVHLSELAMPGISRRQFPKQSFHNNAVPVANARAQSADLIDYLHRLNNFWTHTKRLLFEIIIVGFIYIRLNAEQNLFLTANTTPIRNSAKRIVVQIQ